MFDNLRLSNLKGLRRCELQALGRINVICGKNNSGKSTILESIARKERRNSGKALKDEDIDFICNRDYMAKFWGYGAQSPMIGYLRNIVARVALSENKIWYDDQIQEFMEPITRMYGEHSSLRSVRFPEQYLRSKYDELVRQSAPTVLLPPKRMLDLLTQVNSSEPIQPVGAGILNHLFMASTRPNGSDERGFYDTVRSAFNSISNGYEFEIPLEASNKICLRFSFNKGPWIDAENSGLGLQDLLIVLYFAISPNYDVILVEEPESHLHPDMQRKLLYYAKHETSKQFFFSTHSNIFLNYSLIDRIFYAYYDDEVKVQDATSKAVMLSELGYSISENLVSDVTILTEGPTDIPIIEEFLIKTGLFNAYNIKAWPLGGDIMDQLGLTVINQNTKVIALVDNDPGSGSSRKRFIRRCEELGIPVTRLKRYSVENYFTLDALKRVFGPQISPDLKEIKPNIKVEEQIGLNPKKNNRKIAQAMTLDDLKGTEDLYEFFQAIGGICKE